MLFLASFWLLSVLLLVVIAVRCGKLKGFVRVEKHGIPLKGSVISDKHMQVNESQEPEKSVQITGSRVKVPAVRRRAERSTVLVEEVVVHFDLGAGFEVVRKQHDRYRHLAQVINLRMINGYIVNEHGDTQRPTERGSLNSTHTHRVIDAPHQDAQHRLTGSENLHFLLHEVLLLRLPLGAQRVGGGAGRGHVAVSQCVCEQGFLQSPESACVCKAA